MSRARVAVFVSGGGRSLENLVEISRGTDLGAEVVLVVANKTGIGALERAARLKIPSVVLDPDRKLSPAEFSRDAFLAVESFRCDLVVLAGFLRLLPIPDAWLGRVLNIHPALLPAFGGQGYYGRRVHEAVLEHGCTVSGCTVHYVTNEYDAGPILLQRACAVMDGDTADTLAARVFAEETIALPDAVRMHVSEHARSIAARTKARGPG
ncbi:MAG: phosphoribosylglycinamide formyltransferase [Planctomycetota bacterium]|nr:phosphoribosylglycinamide formyltransferase [Planctomycetota bacterium]